MDSKTKKEIIEICNFIIIGFMLMLIGVIGLCIVGLSSCTTQKHSKTTKTIEQINTDLTTVSNKTVTECLDTIVTIRPDSVKASLSAQDLLQGKELYEDNGGEILEVKYDSLTKKIMARAVRKPVIVPININRTSVTSATATERQQDNKTQTVKEANKEKAGLFGQVNLNYAWWIIGAAGLIWLIFFLWKNRKKNATAPPAG